MFVRVSVRVYVPMCLCQELNEFNVLKVANIIGFVCIDYTSRPGGKTTELWPCRPSRKPIEDED